MPLITIEQDFSLLLTICLRAHQVVKMCKYLHLQHNFLKFTKPYILMIFVQ